MFAIQVFLQHCDDCMSAFFDDTRIVRSRRIFSIVSCSLVAHRRKAIVFSKVPMISRIQSKRKMNLQNKGISTGNHT